jgi:carboxymethylenebutenolidase
MLAGGFMIERQVEVLTADGRMNTFVCHPERGGPHPVLIFLMDAPGIREELRDMALATVGYYVLLPNLYYRSGVEELGNYIGPEGKAAREQLFKLMDTLTIPSVMQDVDALVAFSDEDPAASNGPIGCLGYCMSGQYAISAAARYPGRIAAAASIYGVKLVTEAPNSPHLTASRARAELYVAWAEKDHYAPVEMLEPFEAAMREGCVKAEVELYRCIDHGFAFPQRPAYDKAAAERHWERLFNLFDRTLR